jgi:hypothetical protein
MLLVACQLTVGLIEARQSGQCGLAPVLEPATLRVPSDFGSVVESVAIDFPPRIVKCERLLD